MVRKVIRWIVNGISVVLILISVLVLLTVVTSKKGETPFFLGHTAFRVLTGSMEPELPVDTLVLVKRCTPDDILMGDIVSYYTEDPEIYGSVVTHRVKNIWTEDGVKILETKGDANLEPDKYYVTSENLIGKVVGTSAILGTLVRLVANPIVFVVFILLPLALILVMNVKQTISTVKQLEQEEMEADTLQNKSVSMPDGTATVQKTSPGRTVLENLSENPLEGQQEDQSEGQQEDPGVDSLKHNLKSRLQERLKDE